MTSAQDQTIISFEHAIETSSKAGIPIRILDYSGGEEAIVLYKNIDIRLSVPTVQFIGGDEKHDKKHTYAQIIYSGTLRNGVLDKTVRTKRIFRQCLINYGVNSISNSMNSNHVKEILDSTPWYLQGFWNQYCRALWEAHSELSRRNLNRANVKDYVQYRFGSEIINLIGKTEVIKNNAHLTTHSRSWEMVYPGKDTISGIIQPRPNWNSNVVSYIKNEFHKKALEEGCTISITGKSHPGRRVFYTPNGKSIGLAKICIWNNFGCDQRYQRELFSAIPNSIRLENNRMSVPLVINDLGAPTFMDKHIKFLNCAVFSFDEIVEKDNKGRSQNADQILGSGWPLIDNVLGTLTETVERVPFNLEDTPETVLEYVKEKYHWADPLAITKEKKSNGLYYDINWAISREARETCAMGYKVCFPDGIKGMVVPEKNLFVEKRDNESFYRPIYYFIPAEAITKKQASRTVLHMLFSRVSDPEFRTNIKHDTPRDEFHIELNSVRNKLKTANDSGYSKIYKLIPDVNKDFIDVLGFTEDRGKIIPVDESTIGIIRGTLEPIMDSSSNPATCPCGQLPIMRLPEDEENGRKIRSRTNKNGIRLDPFLALGKPDVVMEVEPHIKEQVNFAAKLYKAIGKMNGPIIIKDNDIY